MGFILNERGIWVGWVQRRRNVRQSEERWKSRERQSATQLRAPGRCWLYPTACLLMAIRATNQAISKCLGWVT
eukprot:3568847-Ditylum_brightwellii.AAC.1